jgi:hypothetical protein
MPTYAQKRISRLATSSASALSTPELGVNSQKGGDLGRGLGCAGGLRGAAGVALSLFLVGGAVLVGLGLGYSWWAAAGLLAGFGAVAGL